MSHMIEFVDGVASMAYVGETPWHGLGTELEPGCTPEELMVAANLDWTVTKKPAFADFNGKKIYSGHEMLIRESDGVALDMVSKDWNPVQNEQAFDFFADFVEAGDMEMHTAGSLMDGQMIWALAKVNKSFTINGDTVDSYLLFSNPHKYGRGIMIQFTPIRVVCNNTLTLSLGRKGDYQVSMSHKKAFDPSEAKRLLGIANEKMDQYGEMAEFLSNKRYTENSLDHYLAQVFPAYSSKRVEKSGELAKLEKAGKVHLSRNAQMAKGIIDIQPGADFAPKSWWNAYNAVTFLTNHELGRTTDSRLTSAWYGLNKTKNVKALETAIEFAKAA